MKKDKEKMVIGKICQVYGSVIWKAITWTSTSVVQETEWLQFHLSMAFKMPHANNWDQGNRYGPHIQLYNDLVVIYFSQQVIRTLYFKRMYSSIWSWTIRSSKVNKTEKNTPFTQWERVTKMVQFVSASFLYKDMYWQYFIYFSFLSVLLNVLHGASNVKF